MPGKDGEGKRVDSECPSPSAHGTCLVTADLTWSRGGKRGEILLPEPSIILIGKLYDLLLDGEKSSIWGSSLRVCQVTDSKAHAWVNRSLGAR